MLRLTPIGLVLALLVGLTSCGDGSKNDGFQKGLAAHKRGDYATALKNWRPIAEKGDAAVQFNLGLMYFKGQGTPQDYNEAAKWYRRAAEQGYTKAQFNLGDMHYKGKGVPQDYAEAVKWFRKTAERGHAKAQINLGVIYYKGQGFPQDKVLSQMWFSIAAAQGDRMAARNRDRAAKRMTPAQTAKAQKMAREWLEKHKKN